MRALTATTEAGADLVARAEQHAVDFAGAAADHDRDGTYAHEHVAALRDTGFLDAPIPVELGGLGVESAHDILVAASRLARGDAATTIGVNMHFAVLLNVRRRLRLARATGRSAQAEAIAAMLSAVAHGGVVLASAASERDQDLQRPATRAERSDDGWVLTGRKWFATMAPAATAFAVALTYVDDHGDERYGFAVVPAGAEGVTIHDDWDGLGMRASGSHSVSFDGVRLPAGAIRDGFPVDRPSAELLDRYLSSGVFHAAASLGIAEAAYDLAVAGLRKRRGDVPDEAFVRMRLAEAAVDLATIRATFDRAAHLVDEVEAMDPAGEATVEEFACWYAEIQAAKAAIGDGAQRIVDRALALSGGAGYVNSHPLSRHYRDVRAGAFMHPLGANRAYRFIADAELGDVPVLR